MSIAVKAARGALWTIASSIGGRAVGVLGTLVMTRFLAPDAIGEISVATIIAMTANWFTTWGFGPYAVVKGRGADAAEVMWHAAVAYVVLGVVAFAAIMLFGDNFARLLGAPDADRFLLGMATAIFIRRIYAIPERVLVRDMRFRPIGIANAVGEIAYTGVAVGLASQGHGAMSIIYGNLVQSSLMVIIAIRAAGWRSWATPMPLRMARIKDMLRYGLPLGLESIAHNASRYWDNLMITYYFGTNRTGVYNMAYNLADIPAIQVGEQVAQVILPSMAELPADRRPRAIERSTALLSLVIMPLAVGLGLIAEPLIAVILPADKWQEVAPLLTVLAVLSVFRPVSWVLGAYMEAQSRTMPLMLLELSKVGLLIGSIALLQMWGIRAAASAVGLAFGLSTLIGVLIVSRDGPSMWKIFLGFWQPLLACAVMAAAVLGVRFGFRELGVDSPWLYLGTEIVVGAVAYVAAALVVCRETSRDLLSLVKRAVKKDAPPPAPALAVIDNTAEQIDLPPT